MSADQLDTVGRKLANGALCANDRVLASQACARRFDAAYGTHEVSRWVVDSLGEKRLVKVRVRFHERWQEQPTVGIDLRSV